MRSDLKNKLAANELAYAEGAADAYESLVAALPFNVPSEIAAVIYKLAGDAVVAVGAARTRARLK